MSDSTSAAPTPATEEQAPLQQQQAEMESSASPVLADPEAHVATNSAPSPPPPAAPETIVPTLSSVPAPSSPSAAVLIEIENANEMAGSYVRTRHKNMRCFPRCSPLHKVKSFCGSSLFVRIVGPVYKKEDVVLLGEFRNTRVHPSFAENQVLATMDFGETYTEGVLLKQDNDVMSFAINPVRKWKFDGKLRPMDHYVVTVFLIVEHKVIAIKDSPSFSIIPIWKAPGEAGGEGEEEIEEGQTAKKREAAAGAAASAAKRMQPTAVPRVIPPPPSPAPDMLLNPYMQQMQRQQQPPFSDYESTMSSYNPFTSNAGYNSYLLPGMNPSQTAPWLQHRFNPTPPVSMLPSRQYLPHQQPQPQQPQQMGQRSNNSLMNAATAALMFHHNSQQQQQQQHH